MAEGEASLSPLLVLLRSGPHYFPGNFAPNFVSNPNPFAEITHPHQLLAQIDTLLRTAQPREEIDSNPGIHSFVYIIPAIAQDLLNSATITLDSVSVLQPRANSSLVSLEASINIPGPFTVRTDPTTLGVYLPDSNNKSSLIDLDLGSYTVHGNSSIGVTNQHTPYVNYTGWQEFVNNTIFKDITTLGLIGPITGHLGKLVAHLHLDKQISTNGWSLVSPSSISFQNKMSVGLRAP